MRQFQTMGWFPM
ncbi:hypothetical protein FWK35_00018412 [Aphis craccivora]|uniref:Uncharacterized protein n=1 Tax=Aphis craccivora TaxID=307492 RepID=A0A6G0YTB8_APHCR|nr:hypothetical protein FWK35_00018412 [Aphis craccivora]